MRYIPHTQQDVKRMLDAVGVRTVEELLSAIPEKVRVRGLLDVPPALTEPELIAHLKSLADRNVDAGRAACFLGGGVYNHYVPQAVDQLLLRSEFYTAYTPYQAEIAQGTLQAIFEFQTMIASLLGMDVANASLYDGGSAVAEAVLMAGRVTRRQRLLIARSVHPQYRKIVETYTRHLGWEIVEIGFGEDGRLDGDALANELDDRAASLVVQSPNYFGVVEDLSALSSAAKPSGAALVVCFTEALAYGLLKPPGEFGADISCGEGQSFGLAMSYGGPHVGLFATRDKYIRNLPGRLCGQTVDAAGERGFVLTLSTREQHIRREKATSNICTNQALCALANTIYLTLMGKKGLRKLAQLNLDLAQYAKGAFAAAGLALRVAGPTFNEFLLKTPRPAAEFLAALPDGIQGGIDVSKDYPEFEGSVLVTVTESLRKEDIDRYVQAAASL